MKPIPAARLAPIRQFPLYAFKVSAGFPSPADDYIETQLDLNEYLVTHKEATFFVMAKGDSMRNAGINDGDLLVVDRSLEPAHCDIVVVVIDAELTVKTLFKRPNIVKLVAANKSYLQGALLQIKRFEHVYFVIVPEPGTTADQDRWWPRVCGNVKTQCKRGGDRSRQAALFGVHSGTKEGR